VYTNVPRVQSRYISEVDIKRRGSVVGVHDKHVSAPDGLAGVELWRFRSGGCRRYIRHGGFAEGAVLVEREKLRVRDDLDLFGCEFRELATEPSRMLVFSEVRNRRKGEITHISTEQDGTFHECPHCKVGTLLLDRQVAIANFHHIHIVVREEVNRG
jgi:hypothetical protein